MGCRDGDLTCATGCSEPVAVLHKDMGITIEEWEANMHFHEGCIVGHVGKVCALKQPKLPGMEP